MERIQPEGQQLNLGKLNASEIKRAGILEALSEVDLARVQLDEYDIGEVAKDALVHRLDMIESCLRDGLKE